MIYYCLNLDYIYVGALKSFKCLGPLRVLIRPWVSPYFYVNSGFSTFLRKYRRIPIHYFGIQFQPDNSMKCGLYVSLFVHYISLYGVNKFTSFYI